MDEEICRESEPCNYKSKALLCTAANVSIQQIQPHDTVYYNGRNMLCIVFLNATCMVIIYENAFLWVQSHITYVTRSFLRLEDKKLEDFTASLFVEFQVCPRCVKTCNDSLHLSYNSLHEVFFLCESG